jgi:spore maturation protein CgeB
MRLLVCHPGSLWATHDVYTGLSAGLQAGGHEVIDYALDGRISASRVWLQYLWRKQVRAGGPLAGERPNEADAIYHAGQEVVARALRFEVDRVLVVCGAYFHPDCAELLRRAGVPTAVVFTESPYDDPEQAKLAPRFDVCFTNERTSVDRLREANPNTHYLPAAYDPAQHGPPLNGAVPMARSSVVERGAVTAAVAGSSPAVPAHDVVFVGSGFDSRRALLAAVDWTGVDFGLYGAWDDLPAGHPLLPHVRSGVVDNARAGALYRQARIALNLYRASGGVPAESLNPRAYELAADGVFTLSHPRAEVAEKFAGRVPTFRTAEELGALVRHFVRADRDRAHVGARLADAVTEDTYTHRAARLVAHLNGA